MTEDEKLFTQLNTLAHKIESCEKDLESMIEQFLELVITERIIDIVIKYDLKEDHIIKVMQKRANETP